MKLSILKVAGNLLRQVSEIENDKNGTKGKYNTDIDISEYH